MTFGHGRGRARAIAALTLVPLLGLTACQSEKAGTTVLIAALHHATPDALGNIPDHHDPASRVFTNDQGYQVVLRQGYFVLTAVEIIRAPAANVPSAFSGFGTLLLPAAVAHSMGSPTRLGAPNVIDLLGADLTAREMGHIEPPPGTYDKLRITWGPADDDAGFLPTDFDMVDHALQLAGRAIKGTDTLDFVVSDAGIDSVEVDFSTAAAHAPSPWLGVDGTRLVLGSGEQATVGVGMIYDKWFNGVDFKTMSTEARHDRVLANIRASLGYHPIGTGHSHAPATWPTRPE